MIDPIKHEEHIHPAIASQLPEFVRVDHPTLVSFLSAYYEWLDLETDYLRSPMKLGSIIDIDKTLDQFIDSFKNQYLLNFPKTLAVNKETNLPVDDKKLIKNIKNFYAAKGTEKTYEFLFRILYDTNVEFYYPKKDILRLSDGKWIARKSIKTSAIQGNAIYEASGKNIIQRNSDGNVIASARVIDVSMYQSGSNTVAELNLSGINGTFLTGNYPIEFTDSSGNTRKELKVFSVVSSILITNGGTNYKVGDLVNFITASGDSGVDASGVVQEIDANTGEIKKIRIENFGVNYNIAPTISISSDDGVGFVGTVRIGSLAQYAGYYANNDSRLSTNKVLQDNQYYQNFSYVLLTEITVDRYRDILRKLIHPAGMGFFGKVLIKRCNYGNIENTTSLIKYEVPKIGNYGPYTNLTYDDLSIWFGTSGGDQAGYSPRVHDPIIAGATGNPITAKQSYQYDSIAGSVTGWGLIGPTGTPDYGTHPNYGQLSLIPSASLNTFTRIESGWHHNIGLGASGNVLAGWGLNNRSGYSDMYTPISGLTGVKDISCGYYTSGAVLSNSSLTCCGLFFLNTNPRGNLNSKTFHQQVPVGNNFKKIVLGPSHGYGLRNDGTLAYWGITSGTYVIVNNFIQWSDESPGSTDKYPESDYWAFIVGNPSVSKIPEPLGLTSPPPTGVPSGVTAAELYRFELMGATTTANGISHISYRINIPSTVPQRIQSAQQYTSSLYVKGATGASGQMFLVRGVADSAYRAVKLTNDWQRISVTESTPSTLGANKNLIQFGTRTGATAAIGISNPQDFTQICGLTTDVYIWGFQVEAGTTTTSFEPTSTFGGTGSYYFNQENYPRGVTFNDIDTFAWNTVGILADGGLTDWGGGSTYKLAGCPSNKGYKQVKAGTLHALALHSDGSLTGWAVSGYEYLLQKIPKGNNFVSIECGAANSSAIDVDGNLYQWGGGTITGGDSSIFPYDQGNSIQPNYSQTKKYKYKQVSSGILHTIGLLDRQELRSVGIGLSAAEPFWFIYQHPNRKIQGKTIARISFEQKQNFIGDNNIISNQSFSGGEWTISSRLNMTNATISAPDGTLTAKAFSVNTTSTSLSRPISWQLPTSRRVASKIWTISAYFKMGDSTGRYVTLYNNWDSTAGPIVDLQTGVLQNPTSIGGNLLNMGVVSAGNGWYRVYATIRGASSPTGALQMQAEFAPTATIANRVAGNSQINLYSWGWQCQEGDVLSAYGPSGGVGGYWQEWTQGVTSVREDWATSFTAGNDSKYAVLQYLPTSEFKKITARAFFNIPLGAEFNCKYDIADSVPLPQAKVKQLNGKTGPYELQFTNSNSPVVGGSTLTITPEIVNMNSIGYYNAASLWCDLYWVTSSAPETYYLIHRKGPLTTIPTTITLTAPFTGLLSAGGDAGMFTNMPGNLSTITLNDSPPTNLTANGKFRIVLYYKDSSGVNLSTVSKTQTDFIYQRTS